MVYQLPDELYPLRAVKPVRSLESSCKRGDRMIERAAMVRKTELALAFANSGSVDDHVMRWSKALQRSPRDLCSTDSSS